MKKLNACYFQILKLLQKILLFFGLPRGARLLQCQEYKYLGIIIDNTLCFGSHNKNLRQKWKKKLGFYFSNKSCFSFSVRKKLVSATFLLVLDYRDVVYQHAPYYLLAFLDAVYHGALRFITVLEFVNFQHTIVNNTNSCMAFIEYSEKNALMQYIKPYWVICHFISADSFKGLCLAITHYILNQIIIFVCPLSELSLVKLP